MATPRPVELFIPEIKSLIQKKNLDELKNLLSEINPIDLADGFSHFPSEQQLLILKLLEPYRAVEVFEELEIPQQQYLLQHLEDQTLSPLLEGMPPDLTARLFKKLPEKYKKKMLELMRKERIETVKMTLEFPPNCCGSLMQTEMIPVTPEMTVRTTMERLQASTRMRRGGEIHSLYVTNENGRLVGGLTLRTLIGAPMDIKVKEIMTPVSVIKIPVQADQEEAARIFSRYGLTSAPVINEENRLVGILMVDDILKVIQEEATEDIAKMAGTKAEELETGSFWRVTTLRMPWLLASYFGGVIASFIVGQFENLLSRIVVLTSFIPVISGMGGNVGTQSSTIIVRGLSTGRIQIGELFKMVRREFSVGLILGITYGLLLGLMTYLVGDPQQPFYLPMVVGAGILTSMTVAATIGTLTPIFFKRFGIDPAAVSAPFVSTTTDIVSISIYLSLSMWLLA